MNKLKIILILLCSLTACHHESKLFYSGSKTCLNTVLVLKKNKKYYFVTRYKTLALVHRISNSGKYEIRADKLILNSTNKLNKGLYFVQENNSANLEDSIKIILVRSPVDSNVSYQDLKSEVHINSQKSLSVYGKPYSDSIIYKLKNDFGLLNHLDIMLSGVMYERYFKKNFSSNEFIFTFMEKGKIDSTKNIYKSYFDNEIFHISKNKDTLFNIRGYTLIRNLCKSCNSCSNLVPAECPAKPRPRRVYSRLRRRLPLGDSLSGQRVL